MSEAVTYTVHDGVAVIAMNNPPVNGLGSVLRPGIMDGLQKAVADPAVKALVIMGTAKAFSGGADIREFNSPKALAEPNLGSVIAMIESAAKPVVAAVAGLALGGGNELALACDDIVLVDDRSSSVSLPEVPLLGVLPGTGGLTRVTDKRHVRHDHADIFCTSVEGVRGQKAVDWRLVDAIAKPAQFADTVAQHAQQLAVQSQRAGAAAKGQGVALKPLQKKTAADSLNYEYVNVDIDRAKRTATLTVSAPKAAVANTIDAIPRLFP